MKRTAKFAITTLLTLGLAFGTAGCELLPAPVSIASIEKTATDGLVDTYTITYSDGTQSTFEVTNGQDGVDGVDGVDGIDGVDGEDGEDGKDAALTAADVYNEYLERYGYTAEELSYEEFLEIFLSVEQNEYKAVHEALQSVVKIYTPFKELDENKQETQKMYTGAGVVYKIDTDSVYFLTNYHVVFDNVAIGETICEDIHCYLYGSEDRPVQKEDGAIDYGDYGIPCEFVGGSITYDLALIKADRRAVEAVNPNVREVVFAEDYHVGETAIAIGNPKGYGISITKGIVSVDSENIKLKLDDTERVYRSMRIDTPIYGGNSGGGLFNDKGELIGLVNAKSTTVEHFCYAVPLLRVQAAAKNLLRNEAGQGVYMLTLGITTAAQNSSYAYDAVKGYGEITEETLVTVVEEASIAAGLGLQAGDVVTAVTIDGETYPLTRAFRLSEYRLYLGAGDTFTLTYERDGAESTTQAYMVQTSDLAKIE